MIPCGTFLELHTTSYSFDAMTPYPLRHQNSQLFSETVVDKETKVFIVVASGVGSRGPGPSKAYGNGNKWQAPDIGTGRIKGLFHPRGKGKLNEIDGSFTVCELSGSCHPGPFSHALRQERRRKIIKSKGINCTAGPWFAWTHNACTNPSFFSAGCFKGQLHPANCSPEPRC